MRSKFEVDVAKILTHKKVKYKYEAVRLPYTIHYEYKPDFKIGDIFIECKGVLDAIERRKLLAIKRCNPDIDLRIWFMRDNWITKAKKSKYSDWAKKNGFPCHVGLTFPKHWKDLK